MKNTTLQDGADHPAAVAADDATRQLLVRAELDAPGETRRQGHVFVIWLLCLIAAASLVVIRRPPRPTAVRLTDDAASAETRWQRERLAIAFGLGVLLPGMLTWWATHRRRRGGPHARGIRVEVTPDGELRLWGRGYGQRLKLADASYSERLVDVFTGRTGAWRERRLRVRAARPLAGHSAELEIATLAEEGDEALGLRLDGGEGDCVELSRADYHSVLLAVKAIAPRGGR